MQDKIHRPEDVLMRITYHCFSHCSCKNKWQKPGPQRLIALMCWIPTHLSWRRFAFWMPGLWPSLQRPRTLKWLNRISKTCWSPCERRKRYSKARYHGHCDISAWIWPQVLVRARFRNSNSWPNNSSVCKWQLDSLTNVIDMKMHQIMQLRMVVFDSNKSRLQAKKELDDVGEA